MVQMSRSHSHLVVEQPSELPRVVDQLLKRAPGSLGVTRCVMIVLFWGSRVSRGHLRQPFVSRDSRAANPRQHLFEKS